MDHGIGAGRPLFAEMNYHAVIIMRMASCLFSMNGVLKKIEDPTPK
jgi:hypothetical protein